MISSTLLVKETVLWYIYIYIYIYIYVTVHHVPKCMSCHKATAVITGRAHIYYAHLASVRFEHSVCRGSLMAT